MEHQKAFDMMNEALIEISRIPSAPTPARHNAAERLQEAMLWLRADFEQANRTLIVAPPPGAKV